MGAESPASALHVHVKQTIVREQEANEDIGSTVAHVAQFNTIKDRDPSIDRTVHVFYPANRVGDLRTKVVLITLLLPRILARSNAGVGSGASGQHLDFRKCWD